GRMGSLEERGLSARRRSLDSRGRLIESLGSSAGSMRWEKKIRGASMIPYVKRRLALIGLLVGTSLVAAGETAPGQTGKDKEAPGGGDEVKTGKVATVDARLPENPLVVPVVEKVGEYGGVWRRAFLGPADANNYVRVVYDALFRFSPDGAKIEPKIAEAAEPSSDYKTWTIKLRKGPNCS